MTPPPPDDYDNTTLFLNCFSKSYSNDNVNVLSICCIFLLPLCFFFLLLFCAIPHLICKGLSCYLSVKFFSPALTFFYVKFLLICRFQSVTGGRTSEQTDRALNVIVVKNREHYFHTLLLLHFYLFKNPSLALLFSYEISSVGIFSPIRCRW